jgi:hypothetical protein
VTVVFGPAPVAGGGVEGFGHATELLVWEEKWGRGGAVAVTY